MYDRKKNEGGHAFWSSFTWGMMEMSWMVGTLMGMEDMGYD